MNKKNCGDNIYSFRNINEKQEIQTTKTFLV